MSKMICPICSKEFDEIDVVFSDNGNPICPECDQDEDKNNINTIDIEGENK